MNGLSVTLCLILSLWMPIQPPPAGSPAKEPPVAKPADKAAPTAQPAKSDPAKSAPPKSEASKPKAPKPEAQKTDTAKSATAKSEAPKTAPSESAPPAPKVTVSPNPCLPGQNVTFVLPPGISQGTICGGKFTRPTEIAKLSALTDTPKKTTIYHFDLRLPTDAKDDTGKAQSKAKSRKVSAKTAPVKTEQETVTVDVYDGKFAPLATYRDPRGWHIDVIWGWNCNVVPEPDPANNTLIYFQPHEDSSTRVAVAITPVTDMSCAELTSKVIDDIPTEYDIIKEIQKKETTQLGLPAMWVTFQAVDHALPDVPTRSVVLSFVKDGKGYVISGRSQAGEFAQWEKPLRCLVRSFTLDDLGKDKQPVSPTGSPAASTAAPAATTKKLPRGFHI